jgi:hypothetical protein
LYIAYLGEIMFIYDEEHYLGDEMLSLGQSFLVVAINDS